jgi:energy-coupling factor transporter transmembrane protein EcfT
MDVSAAPASRQASFPDGDNYPTKTNIFHLSQPTTCFVIFQALARYTRVATCLLLIVYISTTLKAFTIFFLNKLKLRTYFLSFIFSLHYFRQRLYVLWNFKFHNSASSSSSPSPKKPMQWRFENIRVSGTFYSLINTNNRLLPAVVYSGVPTPHDSNPFDGYTSF